MHNLVYLIGRLASEPEIKEEGDKKMSNITLVVQRSYKNENGIYENDSIDCTLWSGIATNVSEYCHKGDLVGIKGRLQVIDDKLTVVADKVSFLSNNPNLDEEDE